MASSYVFQILLRVTVQNQIRIAQWVIVDKVVQFRLLRHGHIQCILNPGTVNGNFSPIPVRVLSALRHSYRGLSCFLMIRSGTFFDVSKGFILFSEEYKKSEPFSYRKKVRILLLWCGGSGAVRTNLPSEQSSPFSASPEK